MLYIEQGATILAASTPLDGGTDGYDPPGERQPWEEYQDYGHNHWHNSLIWGEDLVDIGITGPGRIFGKGLSRGAANRFDLTPEERASGAKEVFHTFVIGVYFFPLLGGWLADRFFGKYHTVLWMSLVYCLGHLCLALFEHHPTGFYAGLGLIALGAGGIKPLVASFVGDQFDRANKHLAKPVFDAFYWIINFGSFFASLLAPMFLRHFGAAVAFGIPGALMLAATFVLWLGRHRYVMVPPSPPDPDAFSRVVRTALLTQAPGQARPGLWLAGAGVLAALAALAMAPSLGFVIALCLAIVALLGGVGGGAWLQLERARGRHADAAVDGARNVLRVLVVFALTTPFFSLFDQKASTWVLQGNAMAAPAWFHPAQMQALNPLLVMLLIPFNNLVLFPLLRRRGVEPTALRKMTMGIAFAGLAWIVVGGYQLLLDDGQALSIVWQVLPYVLLTFGEVLVSATGPVVNAALRDAAPAHVIDLSGRLGADIEAMAGYSGVGW